MKFTIACLFLISFLSPTLFLRAEPELNGFSERKKPFAYSGLYTGIGRQIFLRNNYLISLSVRLKVQKNRIFRLAFGYNSGVIRYKGRVTSKGKLLFKTGNGVGNINSDGIVTQLLARIRGNTFQFSQRLATTNGPVLIQLTAQRN